MSCFLRRLIIILLLDFIDITIMDLADFKYLLSPAVETMLAKEGNFANYLNYAITFVNDTTGNIFLPSDNFTADTQWLKIPLAWIVEYFIARKVGGGSPDYWQQCLDNYNKALAILDKHKIQKTRSSAKAILGSIENTYGEV